MLRVYFPRHCATFFSMNGTPTVVVVGAGLAGLSAALELSGRGFTVRLLEKSDRPGGRVKTDYVNGFALDRGFQVLLEAYPNAKQVLDLRALDLGRFEPGALIWDGRRFLRILDPFRRPLGGLLTALQPVGSLRDKLMIARLRNRLLRQATDEIWSREADTTQGFLRAAGFSTRIIQSFFRPFYGGVFLEHDLATSSRLFEFTFAMFARGAACLPASGMEAVPKQLVGQLPPDSIECNCAVSSVEGTRIHLANGDQLQADGVIVATEGDCATQLLDDGGRPQVRWKAATNLYYSAPQMPLAKRFLFLNGSGSGLVNNVCFPSAVARDYAPADRTLVSVTILGRQDLDGVDNEVRRELQGWFGKAVTGWQLLKAFTVQRALPEFAAGATSDWYAKAGDRVLVAGDHCHNPSIDGAIGSGIAAARELAASFR